MFRKKKSRAQDRQQPLLRGRGASGAAAGHDAPNPLARRLQLGSEPPTIDLVAPAEFGHGESAAEHPETVSLQAEISGLNRVLSCDRRTGKFYVHPGPEGLLVTLSGEPVRAPTELRPGDAIRFGNTEIHFGPRDPS